ncbi:MAG TPA: prolyl oligopeptidase family serine peptidase [Acidobacteriaceae bacterium]
MKMMIRLMALCALAVASVSGSVGSSQAFTLEQALSAPFASDLVANQKTGNLAWVENEQGRRNIWIATRNGSGDYVSRKLTSYNEDDGQQIYDVAWVPDGEHLIYVRGGDSEFPGRPDPNPALISQGVAQSIWAIAATGGEPRKLGEGYNPVVSPAGDQIAFISHGQIWTASLRPDTGEAKPLLHTRGDLSELAWAPDAHALAFVSDRGDHGFIGVYNPREKSLIYLDPGTENDSAPVWSPDSQKVAFVRVPGSPPTSASEHRTASPWSIRIADASTGQGHSVWKAAEGPGSAFHEIHGDQLLWTADNYLVFPWEADGWSHLYSVPASGGKALLLTPGQFEVDDISLSTDRKSVLYSSNQADIDRRHIWIVSPVEGRPKPLTSGTGIEVQPIQAGQVVATLRSDERTPLRPALIRPNDSLQDLAPDLVPATYPGAKFIKPEQVLFPAADGMQLHAQLFLPAGTHDGRRHPALVFFHGGSRRQMLLGFHSMQYYSNAYAMNQYLASLGYIVISVNYRSGIGYGLDFREALHYGRGGASEFNDILGAGSYLRGRPDVDPRKIGVWGGSYGGFLTALALARASDIFAAGVDMHGVHEWQRPASWRPGHDPAADAETAKTAWESSPMASISTWRSPVLLIQGDDDRNVPFSQTVSLANALRKQGVPFEELVFPDEIHGFLLHRHWIEAYKAEADFFQRHLISSKEIKPDAGQ